ncbi:DUF397 domain-containing protein [Actinoallomurus sp. NPDC052274]
MREWHKSSYSADGDSNCVEVAEWSSEADES